MAKLHFYYGAMNSGKSSLLLQVAYNYNQMGLDVLLIKPEVDKKANDKISSRLGIERKVDILLFDNHSIFDTIKEKNININKISCVFVDEAQFLNPKQVKELYVMSSVLDITVMCYGLRTDFRSEVFEGSKYLFAYADELTELTTICSCGRKARFNARIENGKYTLVGNTIAIDEIDAKYESLCPKCYANKVLNINYIDTIKTLKKVK